MSALTLYEFKRISTKPLMFSTNRVITLAKNISYFEALAYSLATNPLTVARSAISPQTLYSGVKTKPSLIISYTNVSEGVVVNLFNILVFPSGPSHSYFENARDYLDFVSPHKAEVSFHDALQRRRHSVASLLRQIPMLRKDRPKYK